VGHRQTDRQQTDGRQKTDVTTKTQGSHLECMSVKN